MDSKNVDLRKDDASQTKMPHERDQSVGTTDQNPDPQVQQGARDVQRGLRDTSRAEETDRAYKDVKNG